MSSSVRLGQVYIVLMTETVWSSPVTDHLAEELESGELVLPLCELKSTTDWRQPEVDLVAVLRGSGALHFDMVEYFRPDFDTYRQLRAPRTKA